MTAFQPEVGNNSGGLVEPVFEFERDFVPIGETVDGPISSFKLEGKKAIKENAVATGVIEGNFQDCGPFSDSQQKAIRREVVTLRGISEIFTPTLSPTQDLEGLLPAHQAERLYADRVINEAVLVEASRRAFLASKGEVSDDIDFCRHNIQISMETLYPEVSRELALDSLGIVHSRMNQIETDDEQVKETLEKIANRYQFLIEAEGRKPAALDPLVQEKIKQILNERFGKVFEQLRDEFGGIDNSKLLTVSQRFLELSGFADKGWQAKDATEERIGFFVDPASKVLEVGGRSKEITWSTFEKLMVHEVGVHATRAENALDAGHKTLALGWLGYEVAEEGLAIVSEKSWGGTASKTDKLERDHYRYMIAAYAKGALDGEAHSVQETFAFSTSLNVISKLYLAQKNSNPVDIKRFEHEARQQMFEHVFRCFRGMPDGEVMVKDILYLDGFSKWAKKLNSSTDVLAELEKAFRGKYNCFDATQQAIVGDLYGQ